MSNYKSILTDQELHLGPTLPDSAFDPLTVAALYGANASGKSNLLDALRWAADKVSDSPVQQLLTGDSSLRTPFKLSPEGLAAPTVAEFGFAIAGVDYSYGFALDDERFIEEWLYAYPNRRKRILVEREQETIRIGQSVENHREIAKLVKQVRQDRSVFTVLRDLDVPQLDAVRSWFDGLVLSGPLGTVFWGRADLEATIEDDPLLVELARKADLGIRDIEIAERIREPREIDLREAAALESRIPDLRKRAESQFDKRKRERDINRIQERASQLRAPRVERQLMFLHGDSLVPLTLGEQSSGTIAFLLQMAQLAKLLNRGGVMVADEIESSIHPRLLARIIELFHDPETNPKGAQLIFSTHDTSLLGTSLGEPVLRRDEVWFVEKNTEGASELSPLSDFKPRKGENQERRYLGGAYGAVPDVDTGSLLDIFKRYGREAPAGEAPSTT
ncbi:AAA family ATPase [Glycomyces buryatensis]|uniref:AAA family ATPase n=1 Tax=Glycomyces buryatensis TaxID=2570927 RepID=UPI0014562EE1|nr:AAA family ATPase [Glycomyces buryatensis]